MTPKWIIARVDRTADLAARLEVLDQTHEVVSVQADPEQPGAFLVIAKKRSVGYDA